MFSEVEFVLVCYASGTLGFSNCFPVTISGLGYAGASAAIDEVDIINMKLPGISLGRGSNT